MTTWENLVGKKQRWWICFSFLTVYPYCGQLLCYCLHLICLFRLFLLLVSVSLCMYSCLCGFFVCFSLHVFACFVLFFPDVFVSRSCSVEVKQCCPCHVFHFSFTAYTSVDYRYIYLSSQTADMISALRDFYGKWWGWFLHFLQNICSKVLDKICAVRL